MDNLTQLDSGPLYFDMTVSQKWEHWKEKIERLYILENRKLPDVAQIMRIEDGFDMLDHQYKTQFGKWKLKKNIPTNKKRAIVDSIQTRAALGKASVSKYKGQDVPGHKLRRFLKNEKRSDLIQRPPHGPPAQGVSRFASGIFFSSRSSFNLPSHVTVSPRFSRSVLATTVTSPGDIEVISPRSVSSPNGAPSPLTVAIQSRKLDQRAQLFINGNYKDLFRSMEKGEQRIMAKWLDQFWMFSFKTAKHWGIGPLKWTAQDLNFDRYSNRLVGSATTSPGTDRGSSSRGLVSVEGPSSDSTANSYGPKPSALCRWSIHAKIMPYEEIPSPPNAEGDMDAEDESTWARWSPTSDSQVFETKLQDALETNDFSTIDKQELPLSLQEVARASTRSTTELLKEALRFSVIARNDDLMGDLAEQIIKKGIDIRNLELLHAATSYLDGSRTCCSVLERVLEYFAYPEIPNKLGHTVIDNLMMTIIKSHTSCSPQLIDDAVEDGKGFDGEEVDICGRWDADSPCVHWLRQNGKYGTPFEWKHVFCHTSAQAICHSIDSIFEGDYRALLRDQTSGLFNKSCLGCALKLSHGHLHSLVLITFVLAQYGCNEETLFGTLAVMLAMLRCGVDPTLKAQISISLLLGIEQSGTCSHEALDPFELMEKIPTLLDLKWSEEIVIGWYIITHALRMAQVAWTRAQDGDDKKLNNVRCDTHDNFYIPYFSRHKTLASLDAAVRVELLTYRRLKEGDSWISPNFDMKQLLRSLDRGGGVSVPLTDEAMLAPLCKCGAPGTERPFHWNHLHVDDVCTHYFSNLEDWGRSTIIPIE
ncbi:MAG: hypothetical protein M1814_002512 [Vezdaea aestivalis]|nr:MAG: hypothetical protein M1814_002512 [Vezdaea aestivalis]